MKCLVCKKILTGQQTKYCSKSHKSLYLLKRRIDLFNIQSPETFIKEQLDKPLPQQASITRPNSTASFNYVIKNSFGWLINRKELRILKLQPNEVVKVTIEVIYREGEER